MCRIIGREYIGATLMSVTVDDADNIVTLDKVIYCKDCRFSHFDSIGGLCTIRKDWNNNPLRVSRCGYCDAGREKVEVVS